jgi:predicted nucleic acid-binding protein
MRIFLDANILFAASFTDGAIRRLVRLLLAEGHALVVDDYVLEEARRNLAAKSRDGTRELNRMIGKLEIVPVSLNTPGKIAAALPEKDRPVLASPVQASCDALVTGDRKHFGRLFGHRIAGVTIYDPASLAEELLM